MKCLVIIFLSLPVFCAANLEGCRSQLSEPQEGTNNYVSYNYELNAAGDCIATTPLCEAEIDPSMLKERTWFITENKDWNGLLYRDSFIQLYNIQCPNNTFLHLVPQKLRTEILAGSCTNADFVRITNPEIDGGSETYCGDNTNFQGSNLYNDGFGRIFTNGNASVEFCTNPNSDLGFGPDTRPPRDETDGFVIRASCIDPKNTLLPRCADFQATVIWDGEFIEGIEKPFMKPERIVVPHKRSIEMRARKSKRSVLRTFMFSAGQSLVYVNGTFVFDFNNGSLPFTPSGIFPSVFTSSELIGSRRFVTNGPFPFTGPGKLELNKGATLRYTVDETDSMALQNLLLPGPRVNNIINRIYDYIFDCWVEPYPVISNFSMPPFALPLPEANMVDKQLPREFGRIRQAEHLGFVQEMFKQTASSNRCYRGALIRKAPSFDSKVSLQLYYFCQFFYNACNPILRLACQELVNIDPLSGK